MPELSKKSDTLVVGIITLIQTVFILLFADNKILIAFGGIAVIAFLIYTAFSIEKIFLLLAFYVSCFEVRGYLSYFPGISIQYSWKLSYPLFILLLAYWVIHLTRNPERIKFNRLDTAVAVFIGVTIMGLVNGFFHGYDRMLLLYDFMAFPFIAVYFVFLYSPLRNKIKMFYNFALVFAVFVGLQFIYAVSKFSTAFFLKRIVSEHIHIAQFAIPYIIATFIYSSSRKKKTVFALLLPIVLFGVIFCQQRSLWGSIIFSMLFLFLVYLYKRRDWIKNNVPKVLAAVFASIGAIILIFLIVQIITKGRLFATMSARLLIFLNPQLLSRDISWDIRWQEIGNALKGWENFWLLGQGFGASVITRRRFMIQIVLDNSYLYMIWKTGIVGLLSLLYMYAVFFWRGITTFFKTRLPDEKIFLLTAIINAAGMMFISFVNVSIAHYRLYVVWAGLFACVEAIGRRYD